MAMAVERDYGELPPATALERASKEASNNSAADYWILLLHWYPEASGTYLPFIKFKIIM